MKQQLLEKMAEDLAITRYCNEDPDSYVCRLLYSAAVCWIKTIALDFTSIDNCTNLGVSRKHITKKCHDIFDELLNAFPIFRSFVRTDERNDWIQIMYQRLLSHGDLVNAGFDTNVTLSIPSTVRLTEDVLCVKGAILQPDYIYSGIATLQRSTDKSFTAEPVLSAVDWIKRYVKSIKWCHVNELTEGVEYFNPCYKSLNNDQCWQKKVCEPVNSIIFVRELDYFYGNYKKYRYLLYNPNKAVMHVLDSFLIEREEQRRFMIGLRSIVANKVSAKLTRYFDHVHLHLNVWLPAIESLLLETYAWPSKSLSGKLDWDMSIEVWNYVKRYLINLGLDIVEENYHEQ